MLYEKKNDGLGSGGCGLWGLTGKKKAGKHFLGLWK